MKSAATYKLEKQTLRTLYKKWRAGALYGQEYRLFLKLLDKEMMVKV